MSYHYSNSFSLRCTLCGEYRAFVWSTLFGTCCPRCFDAVGNQP